MFQTQMEGGSIETRVIIDPPNGSTNSEGKPKVILIQTPSYFFLVDAYLVDPWPFSNLCSWMVGWPIPGTWSPWIGLWDDQGWHQWTQSPQVEYSLILPILSGIIWSFLILSNFFVFFAPFLILSDNFWSFLILSEILSDPFQTFMIISDPLLLSFLIFSDRLFSFLMTKPCDLAHLPWHPICRGMKLWKMTRNKICNIVILHSAASVVSGREKQKSKKPPLQGFCCERNWATMRGEPASKHLRPDGQQAGDEVVWVKEGSDEGEGEAEGDWTLDNPPLLKLQVYF